MKNKFKKVIVVDRDEWDKIPHFASLYEKDEGRLRSKIIGYISRIEEEKIPREKLDALYILKQILRG